MIPLWLWLVGGGAAAWWLFTSSSTSSLGTATSPAISVASTDPSAAPVPVWTGSTLAAGYYWGDQQNDQPPALMASVKALCMTSYGLASTIVGRVIVPLTPGGNVTFLVSGQTPEDPNSGISYGQSITLPLSYISAA
jgi:hypothetical protein